MIRVARFRILIWQHWQFISACSLFLIRKSVSAVSVSLDFENSAFSINIFVLFYVFKMEEDEEVVLKVSCRIYAVLFKIKY